MKKRERNRLIVTLILTAVVAIITNLGAIPIQWSDSFQVNQFTTDRYSWTLLNSTLLQLGSTVVGNATFPGVQGYNSNVALYVLSSSQLTTWLSTTPLSQPKVSTRTLKPIFDLQSNILSFKFSFLVKQEPGTHYFLMFSNTNYALPYGSSPTLTYSATTTTPPLGYRLIAIAVPVGTLIAKKADEYEIVRKNASGKRR
jgi:hypothetical protein